LTIIEPRYRRIVVKVSGESLCSRTALDLDRMMDVAQSIAFISSMGVTVTVIVGGGNIFRGARADAWHLERHQADAVGMAATGVNALLLDGILNQIGAATQIFSRGPCTGIGVPYEREELLATLREGHVALLAGGLGISGFSTDVSAVHAAIDTSAEVVIMSKHGIDGVYDADPRSNPDATFLPSLTASDALSKNLQVMDSTALMLALKHQKYIHVVPASESNNVRYAVEGKEMGSLIYPY
jgi:uridylate kinase